MEILFEIFKNIPRHGPGLDESTKKAFLTLENLPENPEILDIGCGPGQQTLQLAKLTNGNITAIDINQEAIDKLKTKVSNEKSGTNINVINKSMFKLDFSAESFDLIWSEGAIYIIGFEKGLKEWKKLIKPGGYIVASEITWLQDDLPEELKAFWEAEYPAIKNLRGNIEIAQNAGYKIIDHFPLPEAGWWEELYTPLEKNLAELRKKHSEKEYLEAIEMNRQEIELYRKYSDYYGYVFYILQKP